MFYQVLADSNQGLANGNQCEDQSVARVLADENRQF